MQQVWEGVLSRHRILRHGVFTHLRIQYGNEKIHLFFRSQKNVVFTHGNAYPCSEMAVLAFFGDQNGSIRTREKKTLKLHVITDSQQALVN